LKKEKSEKVREELDNRQSGFVVDVMLPYENDNCAKA
jgi:hypothetical protein